MHKDSKGFLWLSTANGLNRFNGIDCKVYKPTNSTLLSEYVRNIVEDKAGNLWIGSEKGLNFYERKTDSFLKIPLPNETDKVATQPYCVDNKGVLWVIIRGESLDGLYTFEPKSQQLKRITTNVNVNTPVYQNVDNQAVKSIIVASNDDIGFKRLTFDNHKITKTETFFDGKDKLPKLDHVAEYVYQENDSTLWITTEAKGLIKLNTYTRAYKVFDAFRHKKVNALARFMPYEQYFFVGSKDGIFVFDKITEMFVQLFTHSPNEPNGLNASYNEYIYIDNEANLFTSQLGIGVDFTNLKKSNIVHWISYDFAKKNLQLIDNHVFNLLNRKNETWSKLNNSLVVALDKNGDLIKKYPNQGTLLADSKNRIWLTDGKTTKIIDESFHEKNHQLIPLPKVDSWKIVMCEGEPNQYFQAVDGEVFEILENNGKFTVNPIEDLNKEALIVNKPIFYDKFSKKLFLSVNWWATLYVLEKKQNKWQITKKPAFPFSVYTMANVANEPSKIWLCTNIGLAKLNTQTLEYQLITEKDGLPDNVVTDIIPEQNGNYWLVTNKGISHFDQKKNSFYQYTSKDGANSKEYIWGGNFMNNEGKVFFAGTNGINIIDTHLSNQYKLKPKTEILGIYVNDKILKTETNIAELAEIKLNSEQNSFEINIVGIDYAHPKDIKIRYFLEGIDKNWQEISNNSRIRFNNLDEGKYILKYQSVDINGENNSAIKQLAIEIDAPFWRTTWFRFLMILLLASLGYALYLLRVRQITEKTTQLEEIKRIRAESEVRALRSQMNPHFIFNCMNTIDSYILLNRTNEASEFLGKFSKLIRVILENSRQEFVNLDQDLKALELYIQLEQERCNYKFSYEITMEKHLVEKGYLIPSLLLQPFVENAILHGLRHKKDEGELYINVQVIDNQLISYIIDNGIGRAASAKINAFMTMSKQSIGMKLTQERIEKLNEIYPNLAFFKIKDINEGDDTGTIIEIGLPLLTQENILL